MSNILKIALCLVILSAATAWTPGNAKTSAALDDGLTITVTSATSVSLSWSAVSGPTVYTVTALDLNTSVKVAEFNTSSSTANVSGLTSGHTIRFTIGNNQNEFIIGNEQNM